MMKSVFTATAAVICLTSWTASAQVAVQFDFYNASLVPQGTRGMAIYPVCIRATNPLGLTTRDRIVASAGTNASVTISNLVWGDYRLEFFGVWTVTTNWFTVPDTNGVTLNATNIISEAFICPGATVPAFSSYSLQAGSNTTFRKVGAVTFIDTGTNYAGLRYAPQFGSANLTNWSALDTNALTVTSNDVVTALGFVPGSGGGTGEVTLSQLEGSTNTATLAAQGVMTTNTTTQFWLYSPSNGPEGLTFYGDGEDVVFHIPHSGGSQVSASGYIGSGAELTNLNASELLSGTVPLARLSGITSNQLDAATAAQLALAGSGGNSTTNAADLTTGTLSLARLPGEVLSNSVPFFTVAAAGIANGLSTRSNNGAMFGPDTPGTVTCGLQEALNAVPKATNQGPLAFGGRIILQPGHFYFTNTLLFSNVWNNGLTLEGAGLFQTKLVYAGTGQGVKTVNLCGTPASLAAGYPLAGHYEIRNIGFTALNNTTNYLLWITNQSYVNINNCLFTSWQLMDNDLWGSGVSITAAQTNDSALVGLHLGGSGDHASWITDCFFQGLATGADLMCDHAYIKGFKTAEIGFNKMCWPATSKYSLGAAILRTGGLDSYYEQVHFYGCKSGLMIISPSSNEHMYPFLDETCDYLFGCDTLRPDVIKWHDSFLSEAMPSQYKIETAPAFNLISLNPNSEGFIIPETFNGSYRGKLFSVPKPDTNTIYLKGFVGLTDFDELPISTAGLTNSPYIWSSGLHSFTNRAGYGIAEIEILGTPAYYLTNAAYPGPPGVNYVIASGLKESAILRPYQQFTNDSSTTWDDEGSGTPTLALAFYGTNWGEVDATVFLNNAASLTNLNASELASGSVPLARLSGITSNQLDAATWLLATNQSGGSGTPIRAGTNVVIYEDTGTNVINAVRYNTLTNVALRDVTVPLSLVATNRDANTNHFMLWFAPDGTNSTFSTLRWTQKVPVSAMAEIMFWPAHSSGYPELIVNAEGSLCFYYDFIQWGKPSHSGPTYEYWKWTQWGAQLDRETGETNFNLWPGATWCFQAMVRTNSSLTNVVTAGSLWPTSGNMKMPTMQFRPTSTNGSAAWIWMDDFDPSQRQSASGVVTGWGTNTHYWFSDNAYTERFRITAGPDGGVSFNGTLKVNGAMGITTNYPMPNGDIMSVSNGIIVFLGPPPP